MKHYSIILVVVVAIFFISQCSNGQDSAGVVVLSSKIGEVIDSTEREYYNLFQNIEHFSSATIVKLQDGMFNIKITKTFPDGDSTASMLMPRNYIFYLANKIQHFEELKAGNYVPGSSIPYIYVDGRKEEWRDSIQSQTSNQRDLKTVELTGLHKELLTGTIVVADDTSLVLWKGSEPFEETQLSDYGMYYRSSEIQRIVIKKENSFLKCLGTGILVGGGIGVFTGLLSGDDEGGFLKFTAGQKALIGGLALGATGGLVGGIIGAATSIDDELLIQGKRSNYLKALPWLREIAMLPALPQSEIQALRSMQNEKATIVQEPMNTTGPSDVQQPSHKKFHIAINGSYRLTTLAGDDIIEAYTESGFGGTVSGWFGPTTYPVELDSRFSWDFAAEYNITDNVRLGITKNNFPTVEVHGKDYEYEYARGEWYSLYCSYVISPAMLEFASRSEIAFAAGAGYNALMVDVDLDWLRRSVYGEMTGSYSFNKRVLGFYCNGSFDYYLYEYLSLQCKAEGRIIPTVTVPSLSYTDPTNNQLRTLVKHSVNFSSVNISVGIRCHL